jgi:hypothetical protein
MSAALSDLFSGLLVATFGGLMLFTGSGPADPVEDESRRIGGVVTALREGLAVTFDPGGDVYLTWGLNVPTATRSSAGPEKLGQACRDLRALALQGLARGSRDLDRRAHR